MCDCLPKMLCVYCIYIYIYIYHVNKFEARLLFLYLPLKPCPYTTYIFSSRVVKYFPNFHEMQRKAGCNIANVFDKKVTVHLLSYSTVY